MDRIELFRIYSKGGPASNPYASGNVSDQLLPFLLDYYSIQIAICIEEKAKSKQLIISYEFDKKGEVRSKKQIVCQ